MWYISDYLKTPLTVCRPFTSNKVYTWITSAIIKYIYFNRNLYWNCLGLLSHVCSIHCAIAKAVETQVLPIPQFLNTLS